MPPTMKRTQHLLAVLFVLVLVLFGVSAEKALSANPIKSGAATTQNTTLLPVSSRPGGALVSQALRHDQSPPLRDLPVAKPQHTMIGDADQLSLLFPRSAKYQAGPDAMTQRDFGASPATMPSPLRNFAGISSPGGAPQIRTAMLGLTIMCSG